MGAGHVVKRREVRAYVMCTGGAERRGLRIRNACGQCVPQRHESASLLLIIIARENISIACNIPVSSVLIKLFEASFDYIFQPMNSKSVYVNFK